MTRRLTDEQRRFIVEYPDYPCWLIAEAFRERFGRTVAKATVIVMRNEARGTSNRHDPHSKMRVRRGRSLEDRRVERMRELERLREETEPRG